MLDQLLVLAHGGAGDNPWFGIVVVAAIALTGVFVLAALGRIPLESPGDLLLPAAVVVLLAGLGGSVGDTIADQAPVAVPVLVVLLVALVVGAVTGRSLRLGAPLGYGAVALAVVAAVALGPTLETTFFPGPVPLPMSDDADLTVALVDGPDPEGRLTLEVAVTGGTLAPAAGDQPDDREEAMVPQFLAGPAFVRPDATIGDCAPTCTSLQYELTLPTNADGTLPDRVQVELRTAQLLPFGPPLRTVLELPTDGSTASP